MLILTVFGIVGLVFGYLSYYTIAAAIVVGLSSIFVCYLLMVVDDKIFS
jgi:uncharacterized membrane protein YuzA (DUF378 family)